MSSLWLHITAGTGPVECCWAAQQVFLRLREEAARRQDVELELLNVEPGPETGTAQSILLALSGEGAAEFAGAWKGSVQWTARSPFRPTHKRKNWFVGITVIEPPDESLFQEKEIRWEVMRASGPGGQHVNRTESAVRVTHLATGIQANASEERSQHRNRKLALARLAEKIRLSREEQNAGKREELWRAHHELERGNAVKVLKP